MASRTSRVLVAASVALAVVIAIVIAVARFQRPPRGPVEIAWDHERCAHCQMLVGVPAFAAQIQTRDGRVLNFDDPGCLIMFEAEHNPDEHAVWFHEVRGDRWLARERTAFVTAPGSPMGYDLGAVEVGTPGAISFAEARARVLASRSRAGSNAP